MISPLQIAEMNKIREVKGSKETGTKKENYGKTIGEPKLSEKAARYYDELKSKFSNKDFILVSKDKKEAAKTQAGLYANPEKMVVLIDEEKIERMAEDENYRKQYEMLISNAGNQLTQMKETLEKSGMKVSAFGIQVDNGGTSFFAVVDKSMAMQRERIAKNTQEKKAEKKQQEKKLEKKKAEKRLEDKREKKREKIKEEQVTVQAFSVEELILKIQELQLSWKSDTLLTSQEEKIGQNFDFNI